MNKYKVQIVETEKYVIDVLAKDEEEAKELALKKWEKVCELGIYHYNEVGDPQTDIDMVFDVTNTDDPFNP